MLIQRNVIGKWKKRIFIETDDVKKIKNQMIKKNLSIQNIADRLMLSKSYTNNMLNGITHITAYLKKIESILDMDFYKEFDLNIE